MGAALTTLVWFRLTPVVGRVFSRLIRLIRFRLWQKRFFPALAPPKLPPPAQNLHPSRALLSPAQMHLPTHPHPPAHAIPISAPPGRPPGSPVKTCSMRFYWVAASNARVAPPPPPSHRVSGNCLSGVGCGVPCGGLTHNDLAGAEVTDAKGSPRVVSVNVEHDALGPTWRPIVLGVWSPWLSPSIALSLAAFEAPLFQCHGGP